MKGIKMLKNKKGLELFITSIAMSSIATGTAIAINEFEVIMQVVTKKNTIKHKII
ncbi:hypothetical protein NW064_02750 [Mycoplasmopsis felis]|uniref:hypothetical protein n=1 Tax=Mycoplasmopsis felis TaxID=33923 RepID=UPI0021AED02E|nr:hypothetical protein [Mycoplasmopsis felis]UWW01281.1 hypothetical protein NW064_02750 [Mycoplasmopsis felis]